MESPERPHVRVFKQDIYVERVPNAWVFVAKVDDWNAWDDVARRYMTNKALVKGLDCVLPPPETSGPTELPPIA